MLTVGLWARVKGLGNGLWFAGLDLDFGLGFYGCNFNFGIKNCKDHLCKI